ncbi:MAG: Asp-tRNA(Asn)/Glu-tRNA(Gln) amidotransferase subunit GatB [Chitinophagaceae bacterium]
MNTDKSKYEVVIGLEVHAQLLTESKLFAGDSTAFGALPNTHVSPITLGHPGTLPKMNAKAIDHAIRLGIVCDSEIAMTNYFARKNYFYPDLPKGYQISQHTTPICSGGHVKIKVGDAWKDIQLTRIHLEEDAGKSIHDQDEKMSCIDYNRAGVPLVEIVTEPDIRSGDEAFAFLTELRKLVRWIGVCDGNMEEGSMRCDANVSVRKKGEKALGTKVEVKNLNSIRNVRKAIEIEFERLVDILEKDGTVLQETRGFDADRETTYSIRVKEDADDYRYFPDPDLIPFVITDKQIEQHRLALPPLPEQWSGKLILEYGLTEYDASSLCEDKGLIEYYESIVALVPAYKAIANWLMGPVRSYCNEHGLEVSQCAIQPVQWKNLLSLIDSGKLNFSTAASLVLPKMMESPNADPEQIAHSLNIIQSSNVDELEQWVDEVLKNMPDKVEEYKKGKKGLIGLFVGEVKKLSKGKADPKLTTDILTNKLNKI